MPLYGVFLKVASTLAFTLMSALVKALSVRYPLGQVIFCRSFFALIPILVWLASQGPLLAALRTRHLGGHVGRGVVGVFAMGSGFMALSLLPLPDAVAFGYTTPLMVVVLAALVLKETVRIYRWSAVVVGFIGALIMLAPHLSLSWLSGLVQGGSVTGDMVAGGPALGVAFALAGSIFGAAATILVRQLTKIETTGAIVFYFTMITTLAGLATIVFGWLWPLSWLDAAMMVMMGVLGGIGQILMTASYRHGDASLIAPFDYTTMIWALLLGWFVFGEWPAVTVLIGAAVIAGAGLFVIWREQKLGLLRAENRKVGPTILK